MKFKIIPIVALMLTANTVSAAVITRNSDCDISISGNLGASYKNAEVQIQISGPFSEGKALEDAVFDSNDNKAVFMTDTYINTVLCDENGKYSFVYKVDQNNKFYTVSVNEPESDNIQTVAVYALSGDAERTFLADINSADKSKMLEILKGSEYSDILSGNRSDFSLVTDETLVNNLADGLLKEDYATFEDFEKRLTELCAVLLSGTIADAGDMRKMAEEKLELSKSGLYDIYSSYSDEVKNAVFERMTGKNFTDIDEYIMSFDEGVFLEKVKAEKYASNLTELINSNGQRFGIDLNGYSKYYDKVNAVLYGKDFDNMTDFKAALITAVSNAGTYVPVTGGGNGGGGSSSSSGKPSGNIIMPTGNAGKTEVSADKGYFDDLGSAEWAADAINALAEKGVVSGKAQREFSPMDNIKREEFVRIVVNAFGLTADDAGVDFEDVAEDAWYFNDIKTAYALGIVSGIDENNFGVGNLITRQDMATILCRTAEKTGKELTKGSEIFADDEKIAVYAKNAVYTLKNEGIISGMGDNRFEPRANATRAQAAKMIYTMMGK